MPRGDGTGPMGMGRMTGRAAGYCAGFASLGFVNPAPRQGFWGGGRGFGGGGRGWRNWFRATGQPGWMRSQWPVSAPSQEDEAGALKQQAQALEQSLADVRQRLADLEKAQDGR